MVEDFLLKFTWVFTILIPLIFLVGINLVEIQDESFKRRKLGLSSHLVGFTLAITGIGTNVSDTVVLAGVIAVCFIITLPTYSISANRDTIKTKKWGNVCLTLGMIFLLIGLGWALTHLPTA